MPWSMPAACRCPRQYPRRTIARRSPAARRLCARRQGLRPEHGAVHRARRLRQDRAMMCASERATAGRRGGSAGRLSERGTLFAPGDPSGAGNSGVRDTPTRSGHLLSCRIPLAGNLRPGPAALCPAESHLPCRARASSIPLDPGESRINHLHYRIPLTSRDVPGCTWAKPVRGWAAAWLAGYPERVRAGPCMTVGEAGPDLLGPLSQSKKCER